MNGLNRGFWCWSSLFALCLAALTGCGGGGGRPAPPPVPADRNARVGVADPLGETVKKVVYLDQGWSPADSQRFYFTSQGSQIVPYDWFLALEQAKSETLFRDDRNLLRFRYLLQRPDGKNPDGLPVGFVKDQGTDRAWLGFTCAACHTAQVNYQGVGYRIDGGPSFADVRGFLAELTAALTATRDQPDKFDRFAARVLGRNPTPDRRKSLSDELGRLVEIRAGYNARNFPEEQPPGYGRVDAFGAILNEVYRRAVKAGAARSATTNTKPADAPVSYPFLWDTPQHDRVQWNGVAKNAGLGALGRNIGEVLGVFADFEIPDQPGITGYRSSVRVHNLAEIEDWLKSLWSPQWPSSFPPIDRTKQDQGKRLYVKAKCNLCHALIDRTDPRRTISAVMIAVGTDPRMADNFAHRTGAAGKLEGAFLRVVPLPPLNPTRIGATVSGEDILSHVVIGTLLGSGFPAPRDQLSEIEYQRRVAFAAEAAGLATSGGVYKGRPLNGIWATAPYLHNGSVASLYELLLPPKKRLESFTVGSLEFDPVHVGFQTDAEGFPRFVARDKDHQPVPGNSNAGHEYGTDLSDAERWQLVEYLKSL